MKLQNSKMSTANVMANIQDNNYDQQYLKL